MLDRDGEAIGAYGLQLSRRDLPRLGLEFEYPRDDELLLDFLS